MNTSMPLRTRQSPTGEMHAEGAVLGQFLACVVQSHSEDSFKSFSASCSNVSALARPGHWEVSGLGARGLETGWQRRGGQSGRVTAQRGRDEALLDAASPSSPRCPPARVARQPADPGSGAEVWAAAGRQRPPARVPTRAAQRPQSHARPAPPGP